MRIIKDAAGNVISSGHLTADHPDGNCARDLEGRRIADVQAEAEAAETAAVIADEKPAEAVATEVAPGARGQKKKVTDEQ